MNVDYKSGKVTINLSDILCHISPEKRVELIEDLSCEDAIIKHVADQIIERMTESMSSGGTHYPTPADSSKGTALEDAWRRVAKESGEVARLEIERLERSLAYQAEQIKSLNEMLERAQMLSRGQSSSIF